MRNRNLNKISKRQWIAFGLVTLQWFLMTATEPFKFKDIRWYTVLTISLIAFLLMNKSFVWRALGKYRWIFIFTGVGWLLLILFQIDFMFTVESVFKSFIAICTFILLIPTLSHPMARKFLFFGILYTAFMRCFVVFDYTQYELIYFESLHGLGKNKNFTGLMFGIGILALTPFILSSKVLILKRIFGGGLAICFLYWLFLTGSRSAAIAVSGSILVIGYIYIFKEMGIETKVRTVAFITLFSIFGLVTIPLLSEKYGVINENFVRLTEFLSGKRLDINSRRVLINLSIERIKDSPICGSGFGSSKYLTGKYFLTHNTYLTEWIERGLPGILSLFLFVVFVWGEIRLQVKSMIYGQEHQLDLALSLTGIQVVLMMLTMNIGTFLIFYICLFAAFEYERNYNKLYRRRVL